MTVEHNRWLVPDGIEDMLPAQAAKVEHWRRSLLDLFHLWGYEQVMPPMVEFVDTLLTGKASDLAVDTCQLVDQVSGRMMGVRSDLTTQVARIDAHRLQSALPVRLCYAGEVLRARPNPVTASRSPIQVGAELFGHAQVQSDIEVIELMLSACQTLGVTRLHLTLGHLAIFRALSNTLHLSDEQIAQSYDRLARKSLPDWQQWCEQLPSHQRAADLLRLLPQLCGQAQDILQRINQSWLGIHPDIDQAILRLGLIVKHLNMTHPGLDVHLDLADLRGFQYHTGVVFGVIAGDAKSMIASGGRYDDISSTFGRSRPATGFSMDLRQLLDLGLTSNPRLRKRILAPAIADVQLIQIIQQLRQDGHRVMIGFADYDWQAQRAHCDSELIQEHGRWVLR